MADILDILRRDNPEVFNRFKLVVVGGGRIGGDFERNREVSLIQTRLADLKMPEKILFLGSRDQGELYKYYTAADALLFPSLYEGFGLPPLEAMSYGLPVVASDRSSLPEVLGEAALYANPEDAEDLARSVDRLLEDHSLRAKLKEAGLQRAAQFSWEEAAKKTLVLYHALFDRKKGHSSSEI